jgi:ribosome-binding protein aMBF1 (putative translation factor)
MNRYNNSGRSGTTISVGIRRKQAMLKTKQTRNINQLGHEVKSRREGLGLTQRALAQKLGVEASHIASSKVNTESPPSNCSHVLADILGVDRQNL